MRGTTHAQNNKDVIAALVDSSYRFMATVIVVAIAGYDLVFATDNRSRHVPGVFGATSRPERMAHLPDTRRHFLAPFEGVETMADNSGVFFTL